MFAETDSWLHFWTAFFAGLPALFTAIAVFVKQLLDAKELRKNTAITTSAAVNAVEARKEAVLANVAAQTARTAATESVAKVSSQVEHLHKCVEDRLDEVKEVVKNGGAK